MADVIYCSGQYIPREDFYQMLEELEAEEKAEQEAEKQEEEDNAKK